ncbi:MAG: electron transport complex subunit RsxG [Immundisolibacteraceae bacterium]|nr:electron transport complex subunit RsxG [Immundisolibacteraceae bacterium]
MSESFSSLRRNGLLLAAIALLAASLLAAIDYWARPRLEFNRAEALRAELGELVPANFHDQPLDQTVDRLQSEALGPGEQTLYRARLKDQVTAVLITAVAADGYNGAIRLLLAVSVDQKLLGVRVLEHRETPGLGDGIERRKNDWIDGFNGHSLVDPEAAGWAVRKDGGQFDQFTAATITPRAVVGAVKRALEYVEQHHQPLFLIESVQQAQSR